MHAVVLWGSETWQEGDKKQKGEGKCGQSYSGKGDSEGVGRSAVGF